MMRRETLEMKISSISRFVKKNLKYSNDLEMLIMMITLTNIVFISRAIQNPNPENVPSCDGTCAPLVFYFPQFSLFCRATTFVFFES